jgi:DNA polymerase-3 subunit delta
MAQLSIEALVERLQQGKPVPAILLLGSDAYLREVARERIVQVSIDPVARDWSIAKFSAGNGEFAAALGQARTFPMLARRQVVIVTDLAAVEEMAEKSRDEAIADLSAYLDDPAPFTVLVLEAVHLDQRMKVAKILGTKGFIIAAEMPEEPQERLRLAAALAKQMARDGGAILEGDAAEELADLCDGNLAAIRSEIEKLATYVGPGVPVRRTDVVALVVSEKKYSVWELADVLASRQRARAFTFLDNLLREGEQPPALVGAMAWMFRKLMEVQDLGPHTSEYEAAGRLKMRAGTAKLALQQARKIPRRQLVEGLQALYDADSQLKSGSGNDRAVMEFLLARLTATAAATRP